MKKEKRCIIQTLPLVIHSIIACIHFLKRPKSRVAQMAKIGALWSPSQRNKLNAVSDQSSAWFVQKKSGPGKIKSCKSLDTKTCVENAFTYVGTEWN
jgi:hypothetical protein